ncbi:MAG TPA: tripartite tricarboxylate transporter substrate binding protein [Xanthobacteraceae bacterium]|jgi:tripartite-type tricarboxylate transporter receptor subunit TctC
MRLPRLLLVALATVAAATAADAQAWPQRPVKIVVPYAAGGNSDGIARIVAQRLGERLGQNFIVENRVGANGALAADDVMRAAPDGYTLMWAVTPPMTIAPAMAKVAYDPVKDFAPISVVGSNAFVLLVNKDFPPKTVAEFVAYVRAQPERMAYAEGSAGSLTHLAMALFLKRAGLEMTNVSYRGNAPALTDVIAGHLQVMFSNVSDALPQAASGAVRLLAVSSQQRAPQIPDVPTVAESGFPGFNVLTWNGLVAPAGTPKAVVDLLAGEVAQAVKDPKFLARLQSYGVDPVGNTPAEFAKQIAADGALWADAVKMTGLAYKP